MIHYLKNDTIILSHWCQLGYQNWVKHRLNGDYSERIMLLYTFPATVNQAISEPYFYFSVVGSSLEYIDNAYRATYGNDSFPESQLPEIKSRIDTFLSKIDNLLIFT